MTEFDLNNEPPVGTSLIGLHKYAKIYYLVERNSSDYYIVHSPDRRGRFMLWENIVPNYNNLRIATIIDIRNFFNQSGTTLSNNPILNFTVDNPPPAKTKLSGFSSTTGRLCILECRVSHHWVVHESDKIRSGPWSWSYLVNNFYDLHFASKAELEKFGLDGPPVMDENTKLDTGTVLFAEDRSNSDSVVLVSKPDNKWVSHLCNKRGATTGPWTWHEVLDKFKNIVYTTEIGEPQLDTNSNPRFTPSNEPPAGTKLRVEGSSEGNVVLVRANHGWDIFYDFGIDESSEWKDILDTHESLQEDMVNSPKHYTGFSNGAEVIDIIEHLTPNAANAVKYLARSCRVDDKNKGNIEEDLKKAQWYVNRELSRLGE